MKTAVVLLLSAALFATCTSFRMPGRFQRMRNWGMRNGGMRMERMQRMQDWRGFMDFLWKMYEDYKLIQMQLTTTTAMPASTSATGHHTTHAPTTDMPTTMNPNPTCDLGDYVCVPRGSCESASDVQQGLTCANPSYDCCDM